MSTHARTTIDLSELVRNLPTAELEKILAARRATPAIVPPTVRRSVIPTPDLPRVTCIMVIQDARRLGRARQAVASFLQQIYPNKHLVIVNGIPPGVDETRVMLATHPLIREHNEGIGYSIGNMRATGLRLAQSDAMMQDWYMPWDDDDHSHPARLLYQTTYRRAPRPILLHRQVRVNLRARTIFYHDDEHGIPGTILHQFSTAYAYLDVGYGVDAAFVDEWPEVVVLDNRTEAVAPAVLSVAFFDGLNATTEEEWMARCPAQGAGKSTVSPADFEYVRSVATAYGVMLNA